MSIAQIANKLADYCRQGKNIDAINELYSDDIVSVEPVAMENMPAEMKGKQAILGKNQWWLENHEVHSGNVSAPMVGDGQFALHLAYDVTNKPSGQRMQMTEIGLYTVEGDKITREEFFYNMPGV